MDCVLYKHIDHDCGRLSHQLETLQDDLQRLSAYITELSDLSPSELAALKVDDQLDTIHNCLQRFETRFLSVRITACEYEFVTPIEDEQTEATLASDLNFKTIRSNARRANKLAGQLTSTITRIRSGLGQLQNPAMIPQDILQLNQVVGNAVDGLTTEWNSVSELQ